jgi:hypothetical protein
MDDDGSIAYWRKVFAGEAGFNGFPQAMIRLCVAADEANLAKLERGFPEAVAAYRESTR